MNYICKRGHEAVRGEGCQVCARITVRAWQKAHPERMKYYDKKYSARKRAAASAWHAKHREAANAGRKQRYHRDVAADPVGVKLKSLVSVAKHRELEWRLPLALARDLITDNCFYCGVDPRPTNGIDRVDSSLGYLENNVVTACRQCNLAKLDSSRSDFELWIKRAAAHQAQFEELQ